MKVKYLKYNFIDYWALGHNGTGKCQIQFAIYSYLDIQNSKVFFGQVRLVRNEFGTFGTVDVTVFIKYKPKNGKISSSNSQNFSQFMIYFSDSDCELFNDDSFIQIRVTTNRRVDAPNFLLR